MTGELDVNFTFDELAGLYFIANAGLISVVMNTMIEKIDIKDPEANGGRFKEAEIDYRENVLAFRENGNAESVLNKLEAIRQKLASASQTATDGNSE